jgi:hypothetical protein
MYAGYGGGRACAGCGGEIGPTEVEYEANYEAGGTYYLHLGCAGLWEVERRRRHQAAAAGAEARTIQKESQDNRERARVVAKQSAQLRDEADALARESEAAVERARQVERGEPTGR